VLFVGLMIVLKPLLFDPMMKLFEERERLIDRKLRDGVELDKKSADALAKYEKILGKARDAGAAERDKLRAEGLKKENELLAKVRAEAASTLEQGRTATAKEADAARHARRSPPPRSTRPSPVRTASTPPPRASTASTRAATTSCRRSTGRTSSTGSSRPSSR
jgi:hypothetical protein